MATRLGVGQDTRTRLFEEVHRPQYASLMANPITVGLLTQVVISVEAEPGRILTRAQVYEIASTASSEDVRDLPRKWHL